MNNPHAFPTPVIVPEGQFTTITNDGMTLRDYFAAAALTGIKSNPELLRICSMVEGKRQQQAVAAMAYTDADAMLKEREKSEE